jgi:hypothetical protein
MTMATTAGDPFDRYPEMPPTPHPPLWDADDNLENPTRIALRQVLSFLPDYLFTIYYAEFVRTGGDAEAAVLKMRADPNYDIYFGGNRREDGSLRFDEQTYMAYKEDYRDTLRYIGGVNPDLFDAHLVNLFTGNVHPNEFANRIGAIATRVLQDAPEMIQVYSSQWGIDATPEALIAMAIDPAINDAVLNRQITMAEIAVEGIERGFEIDKEFAASLFNANLNEEAASSFFGEAGRWVPVLNVLASRHADPNDDFDLADFTASEIFDDPIQRMRMRRLVNQERASFIGPGRFGIQSAQDTGGLTGLGRR